MNIERREGHFAKQSGEIFYQTWTSKDAFATLVVTHGIGEHSESYAKSADDLCKLGWNVIAWDLRGHGRSEGKRGHVDRFADYADDLAALLPHLQKNGQLSKNFALLGHSMGGLVTLDYLVRHGHDAPQARAVALSSPLLGVAIKVPAVKDFAAKVLRNVWPSLTLFNEIKPADLTRDPDHQQTYARDPLRHEKISPSLYFGMLETMAAVNQAGPAIRSPIIVQAAGHELVVSLPAIKDFFPTIGSANKKLVVYDDSYHEIYNDLDRKKTLRELHDFLSSVPGIRSSP